MTALGGAGWASAGSGEAAPVSTNVSAKASEGEAKSIAPIVHPRPVRS